MSKRNFIVVKEKMNKRNNGLFDTIYSCEFWDKTTN